MIYLFQFNDALLYLVPVNDMLKLNEEFTLNGMEVEKSNQNESEFVIRSFRRSFAIMARNSSEREKWIQALEGAISDYEAKLSSFQAAREHINSSFSSSASVNCSSSEVTVPRSNSSPSIDKEDCTPKELINQSSINSTSSNGSSNGTELRRTSHQSMAMLGERAPVWVHDYRVTMCQRCMRQFTFLYRRHHCRACGYVVCTDCSNKQYPLKYRKFELQRVCDYCHDELSKIHPEWQKNSGRNSARVSPNHSITSVDIALVKQKNRSNSCTDLGNSINWASINQNNQSLLFLDSNHTTGRLKSNFLKNQYRISSRVKKVPAVLIEV